VGTIATWIDDDTEGKTGESRMRTTDLRCFTDATFANVSKNPDITIPKGAVVEFRAGNFGYVRVYGTLTSTEGGVVNVERLDIMPGGTVGFPSELHGVPRRTFTEHRRDTTTT
jgi:hypothetical protein